MAGGVPFTPLYERYDILPNGCWQWNSSLSPRGYPRFTVRDKTFPAHRFFYEFYHSTKIPPDMALDHLCKNKACVNPQHLEVVTSGVNTRRAILKKECKRGQYGFLHDIPPRCFEAPAIVETYHGVNLAVHWRRPVRLQPQASADGWRARECCAAG